MPASNRYRNWTAVAHNAVPITGVKSVRFDRGASVVTDSADADAFVTHRIVGIQDPSFSVTTNAANALIAVPMGAKGIFTATWLDSYAQAATSGTGTMVFTTNALTMFAGASLEGAHQALGSAQLSFATTSADGVTHPVTITIS